MLKLQKFILFLSMKIAELLYDKKNAVNFAILLLFCVAIITFYYNVTVWTFLLLSITGAILLELVSPKVWSHVLPYTSSNEKLHVRIQRIENLVSRAKSDIYIITGELNADVYDSEPVKTAFKNVMKNKDVSIHIYFTRETVDKRSSELYKMLTKFGAGLEVIDELKPPNQSLNHLIIIDERHLRMEFSHQPNSELKRARLFYNRPDIAHEVRKKVVTKLIGAKIKKPNMGATNRKKAA